MSRVCPITGIRVRFGNNVSHANNKTRRKFVPNLKRRKVLVKTSDGKVLIKIVRISTRAIKSLENRCTPTKSKRILQTLANKKKI